MLSFQCCYCHGAIPTQEVCAVIVVVNWSTKREASQQFFCHRECFEKVTKEELDV